MDISFKPFTVSGKAMIAEMGKTSVVFGRLYGFINRIDYDKPLVLDNAVAHMIYKEKAGLRACFFICSDVLRDF